MTSCNVEITGYTGVGCSNCLATKMAFVKVARISHLAGEQLGLQPAKAQRQKVGDQLRINVGGIVEETERLVNEIVAIFELRNENDAIGLHATGKVLRQAVDTTRGN